MNIGLIGYGKMGKAIEEIALKAGHHVTLKIGSANQHDLNEASLSAVDVCIEFSTPETAFHHVKTCLKAGKPTVCGTTAWLQHLNEAKALAIQHETSFLYASNFSIGVNLFFQINEMVASIMNRYNDYEVSMEEIHHTAKKDAPSGTAVTLAEGILQHYSFKEHWVNHPSSDPSKLVILSKREDPAPGTHTVFYRSDIDEISLNHTAHSRKGFASGALLAAEFILNRKGIYSMKDVLLRGNSNE